jgi:hypothetical protein
VREQRVGTLSHGRQLPTTYTADPSQATCERGVFQLVFPKSEQAKPRRIQVTTGTSQQATTNGHHGREPIEAGTLDRRT